MFQTLKGHYQEVRAVTDMYIHTIQVCT